MSECTHLRDVLESEGWREGRLSQPDLAHVQGCGACAQIQRSYQAYASLVSEARAALSHEGGMSPESWALLRKTAEKHERRAILEWMLQPALALAMAAMVFWIASGSPSTPTALDKRLTEVRPAPPVRSVVAHPAEADEPPVDLGPGSVVAAHASARELAVFDRHTLELSPKTRVTIVAWNPRRIVLNVTSGSVRAVVRRELPGDLFELRTTHVRARALGTDYRVSVRRQGVTTVRVAHGGVEVTDGRSGVTRVEAGEVIQVDSSGPLTQPAGARPVEKPAARAAPERAGDTETPPESAGVRSRKRATRKEPAKRPLKSSSGGLQVIEIDIAPQSANPPGG